MQTAEELVNQNPWAGNMQHVQNNTISSRYDIYASKMFTENKGFYTQHLSF